MSLQAMWGYGEIYFDDAIYFERNVKMNDTIFPDINIWYLILFHEKLVQSSNWSDIESVIEKYVSGKLSLITITENNLIKHLLIFL